MRRPSHRSRHYLGVGDVVPLRRGYGDSAKVVELHFANGRLKAVDLCCYGCERSFTVRVHEVHGRRAGCLQCRADSRAAA